MVPLYKGERAPIWRGKSATSGKVAGSKDNDLPGQHNSKEAAMHAPVSKTASAALQELSTSPAEKISPAKTRRADKFDRYAWRDNVFADPATPQNAKCLAFGIAKHVNGETGEAYPSTRTLAEVCGMSQAWVRKTIPALRSTGWIDVELGSRGRDAKHCNRFRINSEKSTRGALLSVPEKSTPAHP